MIQPARSGAYGKAARKEVLAHCACWAAGAPMQQCKRAETTRERWQQAHDLRGNGVGLLECTCQLGLSLNTVKRYYQASEPERRQRVPKYRPTLVDLYRDHLRKRRAEEFAVPVRQLLREIRELGYPGSSNLLVRYLSQGRADGDRRTSRRAGPPASCSPGRTASRRARQERLLGSKVPALR